MSDNSSGNGIGFLGLLGMAFIVLRLCGVIDWSWWWVLAPLWMPVSTILAIIGIAWGIYGACCLVEKTREGKD